MLTISVHQHPGTLFPGTGYAQDIGSPRARGTAVNVALPAGTADAAWLRAVEAVTEPLRARARAATSSSASTAATATAATRWPSSTSPSTPSAPPSSSSAGIAERHAGGRWVALGGGGYEVVGVVPRAWSHLVATVAGRPLDPATPVPEAWRQRVREMADVEAPLTMSDGRDGTFARFADGYNPDDDADRAILATRQAVFPWHGLDPLLD